MIRILAFNYHDVNDHPLFKKIKALIQELEITPAYVAEELMRSDDSEVAFQRLLKYLQCMKKERIKANEDNSLHGKSLIDQCGEGK